MASLSPKKVKSFAYKSKLFKDGSYRPGISCSKISYSVVLKSGVNLLISHMSSTFLLVSLSNLLKGAHFI